MRRTTESTVSHILIKHQINTWNTLKKKKTWKTTQYFDTTTVETLKAVGHYEILLANTTKYKATSDPPVFMAPRSECATPRHTTLLLLSPAVCLLCACASPYLRCATHIYVHISTSIRSISRFRNSGNSFLQKRVRQLPCATNHRGTEGSSATHAVITLNLGTRLSGVLGRHSRGWFRLRVWCHDPQQLNEGCLGRPDCLRRHQSCGGRWRGSCQYYDKNNIKNPCNCNPLKRYFSC